MSWRLPESLEVGGSIFRIRTDFRDILTIFAAFNDPDLPDPAKTEVMLRIMYPDFDQIPQEHINEAIDKAMDFINYGAPDDSKPKPKMMDWEQDADLIIPSINKVAGGVDVRSLEHLHWWTFVGYYMEIGEGLFSQVLNIRHKRLHGKKLDKWEREFANENKKLIILKKHLTEEEREREEAERKALKELLGE